MKFSIREGRETNFKKYNNSAVNDFEVGYDYDSVMHYSATAFSKNGKKTIEPMVRVRIFAELFSPFVKFRFMVSRLM